MKKLITTLILLVLLFILNKETSPVDNYFNITYTNIIASFNTLHLGWRGKDYTKTAEILTRYDLIGLQEVMSLAGLTSLVASLEHQTNIDWDFHIATSPVGTKRYKEYYAYIWKKSIVEFQRSLGYYKENHPNDFIREPYGAMFKINNFDFTFVLCHFIFGKSVVYRRNEAKKLVYVYDYFQKINKEDQDIIIAGDFNLPATDKGFLNLYFHMDNIDYSISPTVKTTIGSKGFSKSYDNFFLSKTYTHEAVFAFVHNKHKTNYHIFKRIISDHLPIYLIVNTILDDD